MIERIMLPELGEPVSHFCHVVRAGPHIWVSGMTGQKDGMIPESTVAQFDLAIERMAHCLKTCGAGPEHVVKVNVYLTDINDRAAINVRRIAWFGDHRPASTLVEVSAFVRPEMKVEIECEAFTG